MDQAKHQLAGHDIPNGWKVVEQVTSPSTGSCFSIGYSVIHTSGTKGFLKALDLSQAARIAARDKRDFADVVLQMSSDFVFERDLLYLCRDRNLKRVVFALESGEASTDPSSSFGPVPYLIFECADSDIRKSMDLNAKFDISWILRRLHEISVGVHQLHKTGIAHQDIKPSNILTFNTFGAKLADLGRASLKGKESPFDSLAFPGDPSYAPPELIYGAVPSEWNQRRLGCDLYLLGSMVHFLITDVPTTGAIMRKLPINYKRSAWSGTFAEVLPHLQHSFSEVVSEFSQVVSSDYRDELTTAFSQLCNPDPNRRGHPMNAGPNQDRYSVERYVSLFNKLAEHARYHIVTRR